MAIILDCLHMVGILFSMKHILSIVSSHLWALGPGDLVVPAVWHLCRQLYCSLKQAAIPLLYSHSLKGLTFEVSPTVAGGSTCRFGLDGMVPLPLTRSWWATWLAVTRHGGFDEVGSLESLLIVFQAFRLLWVMFVDVMTSSHMFLFSSVILSSRRLPDSMVLLSKGLLEYCCLYAS